MGTYLYAYVEYQEDNVWHSLCDWEFGKSYELMTALENGGARAGWPKDTSLHSDEEKSDVYAKQTSTIGELKRIDPSSLYSWTRTFLFALIAAGDVMAKAGYSVRVLWGRD